MTKSSSILCPFTLKPIDTIKQEDSAIIYESNPLLTKGPSDGAAENQKVQCGHSCTLSNLVSYLHDSSGSKSCPVCQSSPATVICDARSSAFMVQQNNATTQASESKKCDTSNDCEGRIIILKYGTISYFLWVDSSPTIPPSSYSKIFSYKRGNALDRIGSVLVMDVKNGLKVSDGCR